MRPDKVYALYRSQTGKMVTEEHFNGRVIEEREKFIYFTSDLEDNRITFSYLLCGWHYHEAQFWENIQTIKSVDTLWPPVLLFSRRSIWLVRIYAWMVMGHWYRIKSIKIEY